MTSIRQLIQTSPAKANELLVRLADTSDNAVKTRDRLVADLKSELEVLATLEEEHLFPVLRKHKDTKHLVAGALNDKKQTRKLLTELEAIPRGSEEFTPKLVELRKAFQQSVSDERKELLPAVLKALTDEEAQAIVEKMEDGKAEIAEAKRAEAEQRRADARQEREQAEHLLAKQEESSNREEKFSDVNQHSARDASDDLHKVAESVTEDVRRVATAPTSTRQDVPNKSYEVAEGARYDEQRVSTKPTSTGSLFFDAMFGMWGLPQSRPVMHSPTARSSAQPSSSQEEIISLAEETLIVGKHTVNSGTTTVRRFVVESPAEQEVTLYDERVVVERRKPVSNSAGETLTELTIEMVETSELPLIAKGVRIKEEVVVRRERTKRVETVRDTVRRDEIEISNVDQRLETRRGALAHRRK